MGNTECVLSDEATNEIKSLLRSWRYYVSVDGRAAFSAETDITSIVTATMLS